MASRKYELPDFLDGRCTHVGYLRWLDRKARAHVKRDRRRGNSSAARESYMSAIHGAVVASRGMDAYTGAPLDWELISTYDNEASRSGRRQYKAILANLPTVDHLGDGTGPASFTICGWRTNDCKNDLSRDELTEFCREVLAHRARVEALSHQRPAMLSYIESFEAQDRDRLFRLLSLFARWECALKHNGFARTGSYGQTEPNWNAFASHHEAAIGALNEQSFIAARNALLGTPPRREELVGNSVEWRPNSRRASETDAIYLFRVVRDVRNNLFHGGKFAGGPEPELARDRQLIDSAITVLESALALDARFRSMFEEPA